MGSPDNSKFNNQFGDKPSHGIFTAVHCILGCSALSPWLQCTESSVAVPLGMQTFAGRDANVCGKGCKRLREGLQTFAPKSC